MGSLSAVVAAMSACGDFLFGSCSIVAGSFPASVVVSAAAGAGALPGTRSRAGLMAAVVVEVVGVLSPGIARASAEVAGG